MPSPVVCLKFHNSEISPASKPEYHPLSAVREYRPLLESSTRCNIITVIFVGVLTVVQMLFWVTSSSIITSTTRPLFCRWLPLISSDGTTEASFSLFYSLVDVKRARCMPVHWMRFIGSYWMEVSVRVSEGERFSAPFLSILSPPPSGPPDHHVSFTYNPASNSRPKTSVSSIYTIGVSS